MKTRKTDVVVVGAGPAGAATALFLARTGLQVTVLEARRGPKNGVCGEGIMPAGVPVLSELGLLTEALANGGRFFHGISFYPHSGSPACGRFPTTSPVVRGLSLNRRSLDGMLRAALANQPGVEVLEGHHVLDIVSANDGVAGVVVAESGSEPWQLEAQLCIGADGLRSRFHQLKSVQVVKPKRRRYGIRLHVSGVADLTDLVEVHLIRDGEAYVTPQGNDEASIALLVSENDLPRNRDLSAYALSRIKESKNLERRLLRARPTDRALAKGPLGSSVTGTFGRGYLLVGDAAGGLDPVTGEGLSLGLCTASALAVGVRRHGLGDAAVRVAALARADLERDLRRMTATMLFLLDRPVLADGAIAVVRTVPRLFSWALGVAAAAHPATPSEVTSN